MDAGHLQSKKPLSPVAGSYGHPVHPILVTLPIGGWVFSLVFDFDSYVSSEPRIWSVGAMWLVLLGVIGAALAAVWGVIDLRNIPKATAAFNTGRLHAALNSAAIVIFLIGFLGGSGPRTAGTRRRSDPWCSASWGWPWWGRRASSAGSSPTTTASAWPTSRSRPRASGRRRPPGAEPDTDQPWVYFFSGRHGVGAQRGELGDPDRVDGVDPRDGHTVGSYVPTHLIGDHSIIGLRRDHADSSGGQPPVPR